MNYTRLFLLVLSMVTGTLSLKGQGATDCRDFVVICDNSQIRLNSNGVGTNDFANPNNQPPDCGFGETQSLWLKVPIASDGLLEFVISPNNANDDFDFAIYGPNVSCNNLGASIRCSSTNPQAAGVSALTGLRAGENENSDGPGSQGNGFVDPVPVKAGEEYIILIDNWSGSNAGFELQWSDDSPLFVPPVANNPGEFVYCDTDGDGELIVDLNEMNEVITGGLTGVNVRYFLNEEDALSGENSVDARSYLLNQSLQQLYATVTANTTSCFAMTAFDVRLITLEPPAPINGAKSVCPTVAGVPYSTSATNADSYEWIIDGGTLASGQGTTDITVDWGLANDNATVKLVSKTTTGCVSDTLYYPVRVNKRLEPEMPRGPDLVCFSERPSTFYSVPYVPGSEYIWEVRNGRIIGDNNQNEIEVQWDNGGSEGKVFFTEFNLSITQCEGFSDTLDVRLLPEITVREIVTESLCFGDNSGQVELDIDGGTGALSVSWSDNVTGTSRSNLAPGDYSYAVTDAQGCETEGVVTVTEPELIALDNLTTIAASCYESADGGLMATISGGTGDYQYRINGNSGNIEGNVLEVFNLGRGEHELVISDENGCSFRQTITVDAPPLLRPDIEGLMVKLACPGQSDGAIDLEALGGTPDYQFFWTPNTGRQAGGSLEDVARGDYTVEIVDMNNCRTSLTVSVDEVLPRVRIPSAFSPNGDGKNEGFAPVSNCQLDAYRFYIYNRWGNVVFATDDQNEAWPGQVNDQPAPDGKYSYKLFYRVMVNGQVIEENFQGTVRVFR